MGTWTNNDGLRLKYGTDRATVGVVGEHKFDGPRRLIELKFDYTQLPTVAAGATQLDKVALPVGAVIESAEIFASTDFTSGTGTLSVGTINMDGTSGAGTAIVDAATATEINTGGTNTAGWVGASVTGSALTAAKNLTWTVGTAAFTTGEGVIRIYYSVP